MTAEKGEHERAPRAGESYLTPVRATLRAPPSKWAIKAFFRRVSAASRGRGQPLRAVCPRNVVRLFRPNGRNWTPRINSGRPTVRLPQAEAQAVFVVAVPLAFFGTFFRFERKYCPPWGSSPTFRAVVGASCPAGATGMRLRAHQRAFRSSFGNLRAPKLVNNPWDDKSQSAP